MAMKRTARSGGKKTTGKARTEANRRKNDEETAVVPVEAAALPALAGLFEEDAGQGFENTSADDYVLPFLRILQKTSPAVDPDHGAYVEGARAGMLYDTASQEVMTETEFVPVYYHRCILEWKPIDLGGGFVAQHPLSRIEGIERGAGGKWFTDEGHELHDTRHMYGLRLTETGPVLVCLSFTSTQIKKVRGWMTRMQSLKAKRADGSAFVLPMYANRWTLSTVPEENDKGSWRGWKVDLAGQVEDPALVAAAREARTMFAEIAASGAQAKAEAGSEDVEESIPF